MSATIHPTAIVSSNAKIGAGCYIGPYCYIGPNVTMGSGNRLEAFVSVGTAAEHRDYFHSEPGQVTIGDKNLFREYVTVNAGTQGPTVVESNCVLLRGSHIGHDAIIRQSAILSCNVLIGGHSIIGQGANLGLNVAVHQQRAVGAYAMVGMNSTVTRNLEAFIIFFGSPARAQRINRIGLQRAGVPEGELNIFETWFQRYENTDELGAITHPFNQLLKQYLNDVQYFLQPTAAHSKGAA